MRSSETELTENILIATARKLQNQCQQEKQQTNSERMLAFNGLLKGVLNLNFSRIRKTGEAENRIMQQSLDCAKLCARGTVFILLSGPGALQFRSPKNDILETKCGQRYKISSVLKSFCMVFG